MTNSLSIYCAQWVSIFSHETSHTHSGRVIVYHIHGLFGIFFGGGLLKKKRSHGLILEIFCVDH